VKVAANAQSTDPHDRELARADLAAHGLLGEERHAEPRHHALLDRLGLVELDRAPRGNVGLPAR
jgi:hypothetical protein